MIIVVTGGIGSGKSHVCSILAERYGFHVYAADVRVKELYNSHPTLLKDIETALGAVFRNDQGQFLPSSLSKVIFTDTFALKKVEDLVFPVLLEDFRLWMEDIKDGYPVLFESATVLEKQQFAGFGDLIVLVNAPYNVRLSRASLRDGDQERVKSRMSLQILMNRFSEGETDERIDFVIDNSGTLTDLMSKIDGFVHKIGININVTSM